MEVREQTVTDELILTKIYIVRGLKVMLDRDLAELYHIPTGVFNQAVKRNISRFPSDFMFRLTSDENEGLISQSVISKPAGRGGNRKIPFVFTEQGVAMLSCILHSEIAIQVNIQIIRLFARMREAMLTQKDILLKLEEIEKKVNGNDADIQLIFGCLKELIEKPVTPRRMIGFLASNDPEP